VWIRESRVRYSRRDCAAGAEGQAIDLVARHADTNVRAEPRVADHLRQRGEVEHREQSDGTEGGAPQDEHDSRKDRRGDGAAREAEDGAGKRRE